MAFSDAIHDLLTAPIWERLTNEWDSRLPDPAIVAEASEVNPLTDRFRRLEVDPPEGGVGRITPNHPTPALGVLLGRHLRKRTPEEVALIEDALFAVLGIGYIGMAVIEPRPEGGQIQLGDSVVSNTPNVDRPIAELWAWWVVRMNADSVDALGVPMAFHASLRSLAVVIFGSRLSAAGVGRRKADSESCGLLAQWYVIAGMTLRYVQRIPKEIDLDEDSYQGQNRWPWA